MGFAARRPAHRRRTGVAVAAFLLGMVVGVAERYLVAVELGTNRDLWSEPPAPQAGEGEERV